MSKSRTSLSVVVLVVLLLLLITPGVVSAAPAPTTSSAPSAGSPCCWYRVHWGDTLANIAARYGVSASYLRWLNGIANPNRIYAGQLLRVPCASYHPHPIDRDYFYSSKYGCWGYSYYNWFYGRDIFICLR